MLIYADHVLYQPASFGSFPILNHPQCSDLDTSHTSTAVVPTSSSVDPRCGLVPSQPRATRRITNSPSPQRMQRCGCDFLDSAEMFWLFYCWTIPFGYLMKWTIPSMGQSVVYGPAFRLVLPMPPVMSTKFTWMVVNNKKSLSMVV